jgi:hypothetical protein
MPAGLSEAAKKKGRRMPPLSVAKPQRRSPTAQMKSLALMVPVAPVISISRSAESVKAL